MNREELRTTPGQRGTPMYVASLGREFGLDWLMPAALYCLTGYEIEILDGFWWVERDRRETQKQEGPGGETEVSANGRRTLIKLVEEDRLRCLRALGETWVRTKRDVLGFLTVDSVTGCEVPEECRRQKVTMLRTLDESRSATDLVTTMEGCWEWYEESVCKICAENGRKAHKEEMKKFWDALPEIFGLKEWHILKELKQEAEQGGS
jgi:hypothetical protein